MAAVTFLLEQVTNVIKGHADLISGADKEFKNLNEDIVELNAILQDTAYKSTKDKSVRSIRNQIQEIVYEVQDVIDSCLTESEAKRGISRSIANLSFAKKVKSLRKGKVKKMTEKARDMKRILLESAGTTEEADEVLERMKDPPIRQDQVVGLEDEEEMITGYLRKDQPELDVIPIIGMPGLGKTTLAWKIYNSDIICFQFPIRLWVHFSQRFECRDILIQIMKHFTANVEELHNMSSRELCGKVHMCLSQERFLLVVDDVWEIEHWDQIRPALPYNNANGKVMITSREMRIGMHVKNITKLHMQRRLDPDESWELLQVEVFGRLEDCPDVLKGVGRVLAEKCDGIPMTIVVLGGVLKNHFLGLKSDVSVRKKWNEIAENENLALEEKKQVLVDTVALSYHRLPEHMRDCFLYLGVFPAGHMIPTWTLKQLWIAEGFIQPHREKSLEKTADDILNDLISRNLLIARETNVMHEVKVCCVQTIVRMFCTDEAEKQNLFKDVKSQWESIATLRDSNHMEKVHRLCVHSDLNEVFLKKVTGPRVRSFLNFQEEAAELDPKKISAIFESFPNIRILQSQSIILKNFPSRLIKLNHLRYIVLCVFDLEIVPEQISLLWNLQTIIIHTTSGSLKMKASLWKMIHLRHLKTKAAIVLEKEFVNGDKAGDNLQTLNRLSPESVPNVSRRARNLKTLGVYGELALMFEDMPLGNLNHLKRLKLYQAEAPKNQLQHFPDSNRFPPNLKRLTLSRTFLDWKHMSTLANIHGLEVLKLKENAFTGISWEAQNYSFRNLQVLHMLYLDLVIWTASHSTFPCLRHLELKACEKINAIPDDKLKCLESLDISRVPKSIADSIKNLPVQLKLGDDLIA